MAPKSKAFQQLELLLDSKSSYHFTELVAAAQVSANTVKKHLNTILEDDPSVITQVSGFIPKSHIIVAAVEKEIGKIESNNLMRANRVSKKIIEGITKPEMERALSEIFHADIQEGVLSLPFSKFVEAINDEFLDHLAQSGNGAVSTVGRLNEELILQAMRNSALKPESFQRSGSESNGDIIVSQSAGHKKNLFVEIKSYHARERLLRGLTDIPSPKVGIGFFQQPHEFNAKRTQTLLASHAAAIYLPEETYDLVEEAAKVQLTVKQDRFYRRLGQFVDDMIAFVETGDINPFPI